MIIINNNVIQLLMIINVNGILVYVFLKYVLIILIHLQLFV